MYLHGRTKIPDPRCTAPLLFYHPLPINFFHSFLFSLFSLFSLYFSLFPLFSSFLFLFSFFFSLLFFFYLSISSFTTIPFQMLYHVNAFRRAVYKLPHDNEVVSNYLALFGGRSLHFTLFSLTLNDHLLSYFFLIFTDLFNDLLIACW